jgi:hypothetical protein
MLETSSLSLMNKEDSQIEYLYRIFSKIETFTLHVLITVNLALT